MENQGEPAYHELIQRTREVGLLASCSAVLGWDEQTYMPPGGAAHRGEQMALLAGLQHERMTSPRIGELLAELEHSPSTADPLSATAANIREIGRNYRRQALLPGTLVQELARTTTLAQVEWVEARKQADFARFRPWLERLVRLKQEEGQCLLPATQEAGESGLTPYDSLLDTYESGARVHDLNGLFQELRTDLADLVQHARTPSGKPGEGPLANCVFPVERQKVFGEMAAGALGFDFQRGRLDVTAHPFCTGIGPGDTRITTRYNEREFGDAFFGVLHETGHALYEQGLAAEHFGTPMGEAASLGVHESQSRLWENAVGRGRPFWTYWYPQAQRVFASALHGVSMEQFQTSINRVEPSLIRVQADEVTYNLHIIVRFELEQALLAGDLPVADLPGVWNSKYKEVLGIAPDNDREGSLQDIHWSAGLFGYFPTYTLGNVYAAQLFAAARRDLPDLDADFTRGTYRPLLEWLREKIHKHGQRYRPRQLIEQATGEPIDAAPLIRSLRAKYLEGR